jgi:CHAT domain-containing protein
MRRCLEFPISRPLLLAVVLLLGSPAESRAAPPNGPSREQLRAVADSLAAGHTVRRPPPCRELYTAYEARLGDALRARRSGNEAAEREAFADCELAARLGDRFYAASSLLRDVEICRALAPSRALIRLAADSLYAWARTAFWGPEQSEAAAALDSIRTLDRACGNRMGSARAGLMLLIARGSSTEIADQLRAFDAYADSARAIGDPLLLSSVLFRIGELQANEGPPEPALAASDSLLHLGRRLNDRVSILTGLLGVGRGQFRLGRRSESRLAFQEYLSRNAAGGDSAAIAGALQNVAGAFYSTSRLDSAAVYNRRALALYERLGNERRAAQSAYALCLDLWYGQQHEEALRYCEQALETSRRANDWWVEENANNIIANIHGDNGDWRSSLPYLKQALEIARAKGDYQMQCYALGNLGLQNTNADSLDKAEQYFRAGLAIYDSIPAGQRNIWDLKGGLLANLSWLTAVRGDTTEALRLAEEAYRQFTPVPGDELTMCRAARCLADALLDAGQLARADSMYGLTIQAAGTIHRTGELWIAYAGRAQIAWRRGDREGAITQLEAAIREIEAYRESLGSLQVREGWFTSALWPFDLMIRYCIALGRDEEAFAYYERMKARELLDLLEGGHVVPADELTSAESTEEKTHVGRIEELNRAIAAGDPDRRPELDRARAEYEAFEERLFRVHPELRERRGRGQPIVARDARRMLSPDEIALLYSAGPDGISLLAVTREQIRGYVARGVTPRLHRQIRVLDASIKDPEQRFSRSAAEDLYRLLLGPARDLLQGKQRICFVPDDELYSIPFQALIDPDTGKYLVEQYSVYVAPSLSTLASLRMKGSRGRRELLALGDPDLGPAPIVAVNTRSRPGRLPFSRREVEAIGEIYAPRDRVLTGPDATETVFKTLASGYGVVHLATHGLLDDRDPLYSSLALTRTAEDDGFLEAREVMRLRLDADLVVLSACETARGLITRGEGINGLLRSFFVAGVPTVVASLWTVEDESTALLMTEFHKRLRDGERPADALALAERALLAGESRRRHPFFWAGFLVYGDSE